MKGASAAAEVERDWSDSAPRGAAGGSRCGVGDAADHVVVVHHGASDAAGPPVPDAAHAAGRIEPVTESDVHAFHVKRAPASAGHAEKVREAVSDAAPAPAAGVLGAGEVLYGAAAADAHRGGGRPCGPRPAPRGPPSPPPRAGAASSRSPTRRAASARPRPPSTSPPRSRCTGSRSLVIDLDPQGNASTALGVDHRAGRPRSTRCWSAR